MGEQNPDGWFDRAACAGVDPELFFPSRGHKGNATEARTVCLGCPVRSECLDYAIEQDEQYGIWAGLTRNERDQVARRRRLGLTA